MQVRIPSDAQLLAWGASVGHFPSDPPPSNAGEAIVVGTLDWSETLPGWIGKWRMRWDRADYRWGISGVNYDAAFRNIVRGDVLAASGTGSPDQGELSRRAGVEGFESSVPLAEVWFSAKGSGGDIDRCSSKKPCQGGVSDEPVITRIADSVLLGLDSDIDSVFMKDRSGLLPAGRDRVHALPSLSKE
jgi:hypothetical protein